MLVRLLAVTVAALVVIPCADPASVPISGLYETTLQNTGSTLLDATWRIAITVDGAYTIRRNTSVVVHGHVVPRESELRFRDTSGSASCVGGGTAGSYDWSVASRAGHEYLVLHAVHDACAGRKAVLSSVALRKLT